MSELVSVAQGVDHKAHSGAIRSRCGLEQFAGGSFFSVDTDEFDEFCHYTKGWTIDHELRGALKPHSFMSGVLTPTLQLAIAEHSMGYSSQGRNPEGALSIITPLDERPMKYRGRVIEPMQASLARCSEGFELVCGSGSKFVAVSVQEEKAERYAAEVVHRPLSWGSRSADRLQFSDPSYRMKYIAAVTGLFTTIAESPTLLSDKRNAALLEEKLLECLPLDAHSDSQAPKDRGRYRAARLAYRLLHDHIDDVPSIRDLCVFAGTSYATLERGFQEIYGMAPKTLMQEVRLLRARRELLRPNPSTTVTTVALRWGFLGFGRFAGQYRQRFGEVPSETLRKSRGDACPIGGPFARSYVF